MTRTMKKIKDAFPNMLTGTGLFEYLETLGVPWAGLNISDALNQMYAAHGFVKIVSPFLFGLMTEPNGLSAVQAQTVARMLAIKYNDKWTRLWALGEIEYNPISAGSLTEHEETTETRDRDDTDTGTSNGTNSGTVQNSGSATDTGTGSTNEQIYGFNSSTGQNANTTTENRNYGSSTSNTETRNLSDSRSQNLAHTEDETVERSRDLTRETTAANVQDLINAERMLWDWNFWNQVFGDIDELLTLDIY